MSGIASPTEVIEAALAASTLADCLVVVEDRFDADVRFANNTATTNGERRDRTVSVVSIAERAEGRSVGAASMSGDVNVADLVAAAEADAKESPPAEDAYELVGPEGGEDDLGAEAGRTDLAAFGPLLAELAEAFKRAQSEGRVLAGFATHEASTISLASSTGLRRRHVQLTGSLELVARSSDGSRSAWAAVGAEDFAGVDLPALEERLVRRLAWAERRVDLPAGRYEVVLPPDAVADLVIELYSAMSGRDAEDGGNVFSASGGGTRRGERLFELPFGLSGDPRAEGIACAPFVVTSSSGSDSSVFDNGMPIGRVDWVRDGELANLRYHRAGAARSGTAFAPAVDNLLLEAPGATSNLDDLVASTSSGLLLTCLWYIREVDPATLLLTGLTRDGVYLVEGGEVVGAVNNFRFNESPVDLLANTIEAGASTRCLSREWGEWMNRTSMPPLRVAEFNMSSVSQAS